MIPVYLNRLMKARNTGREPSIGSRPEDDGPLGQLVWSIHFLRRNPRNDVDFRPKIEATPISFHENRSDTDFLSTRRTLSWALADKPSSSMAALRMHCASGLSVQNLRTWRGVIRPLTVGPWVWARDGQCPFDRGCGFRNGLGRQRPFVPGRTGMGYDEEHHLLDVAADAVARDERSSIRERRWTMPEPAKDKDKSAKWLIEHHGDAILRLGGVTDLVRWQAAAAELVLPTKLPDGLLFAWRAGRDHPEPFVVEIATYPELRAAEQALRDLLLVYLVRGEVANILVLVLRPKGQLRVPDHAHRPGSDGVTALGVGGGWSSCGRCPPSRCWRRRTQG